MAVINTPDELFNLAQLGRKLKPRERLQVMVWLERSGQIEKYSEHDIARIFKCKVGAVKQYHRKARQELASAITTEEAMNYMADFVRSLNFIIKEAKTALGDEHMRGTGIGQAYLRILMDAESEKIDKLQSVGVIPKELGRLTSVKEEWVAEVAPEGQISCRPADANDDATGK